MDVFGSRSYFCCKLAQGAFAWQNEENDSILSLYPVFSFFFFLSSAAVALFPALAVAQGGSVYMGDDDRGRVALMGQ